MKSYKVAVLVGAVAVSSLFGIQSVRAGDGPELSAKMTTAKTIDTACVQSAIDKRDTAVIAAFDVFHTTVVSALQTRRDALKAAWGMADKAQRNAASKAAWSAYSTSLKAARKALVQSRHAAWNQFRTDRKTCNAPAADYGAEGRDVSL